MNEYIEYLTNYTKSNPKYLDIIKNKLTDQLGRFNTEDIYDFCILKKACVLYNTTSTLDTVKLLLEHDNNKKNKTTRYGIILTECIIREKDHDIISLLLEHNADINQLYYYDRNIISRIIITPGYKDKYNMIKYLLENTCVNIKNKDEDGCDACKYATDMCEYEILELLKTHLDTSLDVKCALD